MDPVLVRALGVLLLVAVVTLIGRWWRQRDRAVQPVAGSPRFSDDDLAEVGLDLDGAQAGAVLLGSPTCAPCQQVKRVLGEVADEQASFRWVYADAGDHLDLADRYAVRRVPTLFVVDAAGHLLARTSGVPTPDELRQVLDDADVRVA